MHILLPSDVFPPGSVGGAAWSAHALARALIGAGHTVTAVVPVATQSPRALWAAHPDGTEPPPGAAPAVPTLRAPYFAPPLPLVQNYFRHERLWPRLAALLVRLGAQAASQPLLIHAQHAQTTPAAVLAGRRLGVPVVATVRDHWPWDYFATGLHGDRLPYAPRAGLVATWAGLATDLVARLGPLAGALALPAVPALLAHVRRRAALLAQADAVIAVSSYIAQRLAPLVPATRLHVIPNMVDSALVEQTAATPLQTPLSEPFLLFVGKLERNKGAALLIDIVRALPTYLPNFPVALPLLVVAGTGALRDELARELAALGVRARFLAWVDHDEIVRLFARCRLLLFPSAWGEPLSRVLLEASAVGAPILAMPTGGTPGILQDGVNGALAATPEAFARRLAGLLADADGCRQMGAEARRLARQRFAVEVVLPQVEQLYAALGSARQPNQADERVV